MLLDTAIRHVFALYLPGGRYGHQFWCKQSTCGVVKSLSGASIQKARNRSYTQRIKVTSCIRMLNAVIVAEQISKFSSFQMLKQNEIGSY
jgi:hypothetical protein